MGWFNLQPVNDIDRGREAMVYFHNRMVSYSNYSLTADQLIDLVAKGNAGIFLDAFGFAINSIEMSDSKVQESMANLAIHTNGKIPIQSEFFRALSVRVSNLTFMDYVGGAPEIAGGMAMDVVKGAQAVGDAVIDTGKSLLVIGPLLAVAAIVFIGYAKTRQYAGR